jgi:hypothetical protein
MIGRVGLSFIGLWSWRGLVRLQLAGTSLARTNIAGPLAARSGQGLLNFNLPIEQADLSSLVLHCDDGSEVPCRLMMGPHYGIVTAV